MADARSDLVFNTRQLGLYRKPGSWRKLELVVKAPADLKIEVIGIEEGSDLSLDLQLESVVEGVYVSGTVRGLASGIDIRTLEPLEREIVAEIQELFVYPDEEFDSDDELYSLDVERLDFEPALRDAMVMALPFRPVAEEDDTEFSYQTGDSAESDNEESDDPRWSALKSLLDEKKES
ncbi:YceD family protein [Saxibacter everestensis]|uniref:YceD family protein n=1 Tax=Saxibacter everestensis TaxID=2909229 RepID=A0ABY8QXR1_9MICO|nr:YceD family protein [Brevibacteriaceae bacterium ZFBP1038]